MPLAWLCADTPLWAYALIVLAVALVGIWAAARADASWQTHDSRRIVIDEVAGYLVTVALVDRSDGALLLLGFVVFRALDIIKPPPVRWIDRNVPGGAGVVLDDVAAGLLGCAVLLALSWAGFPGAA